MIVFPASGSSASRVRLEISGERREQWFLLLHSTGWTFANAPDAESRPAGPSPQHLHGASSLREIDRDSAGAQIELNGNGE